MSEKKLEEKQVNQHNRALWHYLNYSEEIAYNLEYVRQLAERFRPPACRYSEVIKNIMRSRLTMSMELPLTRLLLVKTQLKLPGKSKQRSKWENLFPNAHKKLELKPYVLTVEAISIMVELRLWLMAHVKVD